MGGAALFVIPEPSASFLGEAKGQRHPMGGPFSNELEVGTLYLNRTCSGGLMSVHSFGGMKLNGTNPRGGARDTLQHFMELKSIGERL